MSAHEFHHCEHTPLGPPPVDTAEQIRQATAEGEKVGAMLPEHLRTTPTPTDPADIRPGDVVHASATFEVEQVTSDGTIYSTDGAVDLVSENVEAFTWHLVHRPDPDAEVIEALLTAGPAMLAEFRRAKDEGITKEADEQARDYLAALRESGWDVVRRQP